MEKKKGEGRWGGGGGGGGVGGKARCVVATLTFGKVHLYLRLTKLQRSLIS